MACAHGLLVVNRSCDICSRFECINARINEGRDLRGRSVAPGKLARCARAARRAA